MVGIKDDTMVSYVVKMKEYSISFSISLDKVAYNLHLFKGCSSCSISESSQILIPKSKFSQSKCFLSSMLCETSIFQYGSNL